MDDFFRFFKKIGFSGILGSPYCGIGVTIRIGREMLCLPYAGFLVVDFEVELIVWWDVRMQLSIRRWDCSMKEKKNIKNMRIVHNFRRKDIFYL